MGYLGRWQIDALLTFSVTTHTASTGAVTDADSVPIYRLYEDETATPILTGSMAKLDDANTTGFYSEQITVSAANGFEVGKCYTILVSATVSSVTGTLPYTFQVEAAPATAAALATAQTSIDDLPTNAELATSQAAADDATLAAIAALNNLSAAQVNTEVDTALVDVGLTTTITGRIDAAVTSRLATAGYTAPPSVADILASVIEGSITLKGALRLALSILTGEASGGGTTTLVYRDTGDTKARATFTVDSSGNRTAVIRDITD